MDVTERFVALVHGPEAALPLDLAALLVAAHGDPGIDVDRELERLDALAAGVREPTLDGVCRHLFGDLGFRGVDGGWDDPRASYLHEVVASRTGIPITLSIVLMEVGRRLGVPLDGVSMPGHFLVRDKVDRELFVDAFARGARLDRRGATARFHQVHGPAAPFDDAFLEPAGRLAIVARVLANLEGIATRGSDRDQLTWVLRLRASLPGAGAAERRRYAAVLATTGRVLEAATVLDGVAAAATGDEAVRLRGAALRLRAQLN